MNGWISKFPSKDQIGEAFISMKDNFMEMANRAIHSTTEFFSDFLAQGKSVQSANIGREKEIRKVVEMQQKENDKNLDKTRNAAEAVIEGIKETLQERSQQELHDNFGYNPDTGIFKVDGKEMSEEVLDDHIKRAEDDIAQFAKDKGISEDEALIQLAAMQAMKEALEIGTPEAIAAARDKFPNATEVWDDIHEDSKAELDRKRQAEINETSVDASSDLSQVGLQNEHNIADEWLDDFEAEVTTDKKYGSLAASTDNSISDTPKTTLNSEYNVAAKGEVISINNTAEFDNSAAYQISDKDVNSLEVSIG